MKITVIVDNEAADGLMQAWGLSMLVEHRNQHIIFDADTEPRVLEHNSKLLGIDLGDVDYGVLSHPHRDHYGGFRLLGRLKPGLTVYMPGGSPQVERILRGWNLDVKEVYNDVEVGDGVLIVGPFEGRYRAYTIPEVALVVYSGRDAAVLVGCSHPGVDRIVEKVVTEYGFRVKLVAGGFHDPPSSVIDRLVGLVEGRICPMHCSGAAKMYLRIKYPEKLQECKAGSTISI